MQKEAVGKVLSLFVTSVESNDTVQRKQIKVEEKGIVNDKHYDKNINRSILITSSDSYQIMKDHAIEPPRGVLGENLLIDYNPYHLDIGTQLQIGTAILEISQPCTLCGHLSSIDKKVPTLLKNDRGIFAKVIQSGTITESDQIFLLN